MMVNVGKSRVSFLEVSEENKLYLLNLFPYTKVDLQAGIKYLGFYLKPNDYSKRDWGWMITKVARRLYIWCNKWLSRGGKVDTCEICS
jgi:hypothetical protein